ncbi:two-component system C4-dicarboxylate transport response regulator DctD [Inquilinus ginsengisoli]|uniref:Two-component system C4-dicarboxylate transport response regulator DctD n=1 Tax=Inquilinus ginsengisoli TaxID=363840 RepID=A0ABU1JJF6_9PROT|nr:sigma-54 dependent transcriptional regulator [Inquilinus ginsengisoli]MDR6288738.1 two-component system C4-dicarboxylate transport response regulator DctD [Inquilinus ginsengisoli]
MSAAGQVVFVDDEAEIRHANVQSLELAGFEVAALDSARAALAAVDRDFAGVVVTDIRMPETDGLALFRQLRALDPDLPVILITGHGDIAMAVAAMRDGAYDFLAKPYPADRLVDSVRRALEKRRLVIENRRLRAALEGADGVAFLGDTPEIERLRRTVRDVADADVDVLVLGETGSGKEVVAEALHRWSRRRTKPLVALNCGALPESVIESELFGHEAGAFTGAQKRRIGRIEHADGGTLFLDEVESMPPALQVKLLRVLEERAVAPLGTNERRPLDLRVVAATKIDLKQASQVGRFRADLYYRLNVVTLRVPPLRERRADIPLLFAHFLGRAAERFRRDPPALGDAVRRRLLDHDWPGNVRELAHFADRVALGLGDAEGLEEPEVSASLPERVERYEAALLREALAAHRGDVRATTEALGLPRKTFYDKLARHGIDPSAYRAEPIGKRVG